MKKIPGYGVVTAMLTPLDENEKVDVTSVKKIVERMCKAEMSGIFTISTSGESARLSRMEQDILMNAVAEANDGRCLLYIGIGAPGLNLALENLRRAEKAGADVIVSTLPYYYGATTVEEQVEYFMTIAENTSLPVLMYNIPGNVGNRIEPEAARILSSVPNIVGIKDSSGDDAYFNELMSFRNDSYRVLHGIEFKASWALKLGADGIVPSLSTIYPSAYMSMFRAAEAKDWAAVDEWQETFSKINSIHKRHTGKMNVVSCRKILMSYEGLGKEYVTHPYVPVPEELKNELIETANALRLS